MLKSTILTAMLLATSAAAQEPPPVEVDIVGGGVKSAITIAVPAMPSAGGAGDSLGRQIAEVISSDLRSTGLFTPLGPSGIGSYSYAQASSPGLCRMARRRRVGFGFRLRRDSAATGA